MNDKATDKRPPFFMVEDAVLDYKLTPYEGWLYIVIVKHADRKTGEAFPSIKTLASITGMSRASVIRATKSLEAKGLISVTRDENAAGKDREVNHYFVLVATPVSHSNRPGITKILPPVSQIDMNKSQLEQEKDSSPNGAGASPAKTAKPRKPNPSEPWHDALIRAFGIEPGKLTKTADGTYWKAAAELKAVDFPVEQIEPLYRWCKAKDWKDFTVMAMAKHAPTFLAHHKPAPNGWIPVEERTSPLDNIVWAGEPPDWYKALGKDNS